MERYTDSNLPRLYEIITAKDGDLKKIVLQFGYPPLWTRPNTFATLVLTILEQQVSLASAYAAYVMLQNAVGLVSPQAVLSLTDAELRACYFSRQKTAYVRGLARAIVNKQLDLEHLYHQPDAIVRTTLKQLKGIGDWTVDIYLIHALQRIDVFPIGDLALVKALYDVKALAPGTKREALLHVGEYWRPYRTPATLLLWHYYLQKRGVKAVI